MMERLRRRGATDTILMVRPSDFGYNEETGWDNEFQHRPGLESEIRPKAMREFDNMVQSLTDAGVTVLVLEKSENHWHHTPDAVFPNNWFSTEPDGTVISYPMLAENRRAEKRIDEVEKLLENHGFHIRNFINIGKYSESKLILEGTGSMVIDHLHNRVYAALSQRCHPDQFWNFMQIRGYEDGVLFNTESSRGNAVYHTNVMMSVGEHVAVVCSDCITIPSQRGYVMNKLNEFHEVVEISMEQMERHFCGNILQIRNGHGDPLIVMSKSAFEGFNLSQRKVLEKHGTLVPVDITTIETVGGGSARCMMAEVFLPRAEESKVAV